MKRHPSPLIFQLLVFITAGCLQRSQVLVIDYLREENRVLRQQLTGHRLRFTDEQRRCLAVRAAALGKAVLAGVATVVTADTLLRWYRELVARKYDGSGKRCASRPVTQADLAAVVLRMARENPSWGYMRIRGGLYNLGHDLARSTIQRILSDAGIEPAPDRERRGSWSAFLKAHAGAVAAADFFSVEVLTWVGIVRYHVLFAIDLESRRVGIAGIVRDVHQAWVVNAMRALLDPLEGFLKDTRYLIHDRDPVLGAEFSKLLLMGGVKSVRLPARSPNLNAFAERFVGSIRRECLARVIPLGERHLRTLVTEYVEHYHTERNHQGVGNRLLAQPVRSSAAARRAVGPVQRRERLGGLLSFYHRDALDSPPIEFWDSTGKLRRAQPAVLPPLDSLRPRRSVHSCHRLGTYAGCHSTSGTRLAERIPSSNRRACPSTSARGNTYQRHFASSHSVLSLGR